jgi:hypothetical protein
VKWWILDRLSSVVLLLVALASEARADDVAGRRVYVQQVSVSVGGRAMVQAFRTALEDAIRSQPGVELVARADGAGSDVAIVAKVRRIRGRYVVTLSVNGSGAAPVSRRMRTPRLSAREARTLVAELLERHESNTATALDSAASTLDRTDAAPNDASPPTATSNDDPAEPAEPAANDTLAWDAGWSEKPSFAPVEPPPISSARASMSGRVKVEHFRYLRRQGDPIEGRVDGRDSVDLLLVGQSTSRYAQASAELSVRRDLSDARRNRAEAMEAYGQLGGMRLNVRAGRFLVAWGTTDLASPADLLNPRDLRDPLAPEKLGAWMIRGAWTAGPLQWEAYYLPVPEPHLLPLPLAAADGELVASGRWVLGRLPPIEDVEYIGGEVEPRAPLRANSQGATRLAVSASGVDVSLAYVYRFDPLPSVRATPIDPATIRLDLFYQRAHVGALAFETTFGRYRLACESTATLLARPNADGRVQPERPLYSESVAGIDFRTGQFNDDHTIEVVVNVAHARVLRGGLEPGLARLRIPFTWAGYGRIAYHAGDDLEVRIDGIAALDGADFLIQPALAYRVAGIAKLELGITLLGGDDDGYLGPNSANARAFGKIEATF